MNQALQTTEAARHLKVIRAMMVAAVVFLSFAMLKTLKVVFVPLTVAFLSAVMVRPLQRWLRDHMHRRLTWVSYTVAILVVIGVMALFVYLVVLVFLLVVSDQSGAIGDIQHRVAQARDWAVNLGLPIESLEQLFGSQGGGAASDTTGIGGHAGEPATNGPPGAVTGESGDELGQLGDLFGPAFSFVTSTLASVTHLVTMLLLVLFLTLLLLLEWEQWGRKVQAMLRKPDSDKPGLVMEAMSSSVRGFLMVQTVVSLIAGVSWGVFLWLMGVPFAIPWAILAFLLNYIPTVGSILSAVPPILVAFLVLPLWKAFFVLGGIVLIEQVIGNYVNPRLMGRSLRLSVLMVLISLTFWSWMWGVIGTFLAVPVTAMFAGAAAYIPGLRPVAILLGGEPEDMPESSKKKEESQQSGDE